MKVLVEVKEEKILQFYDLLNAVRDDFVINFYPVIEEDVKDTEYENISDDNRDKSA